jgi:nitrogen fixation protein FixH
MLIALPAGQLAQRPTGTLRLYRPDSPKQDRELPLEPHADGTQALNTATLATGPWLLQAAWQAGGQAYYLEQKFTVPAK